MSGWKVEHLAKHVHKNFLLGGKSIVQVLKDGNAAPTPKTRHRAPRLPRQEPKPDARIALVLAAQRARESQSRIIVRITGCACRLKDPDNFSASCKAIIDQLRYAGLITNDRNEDIRLIPDQAKVNHRHEEGTVVEIEYPA